MDVSEGEEREGLEAGVEAAVSSFYSSPSSSSSKEAVPIGEVAPKLMKRRLRGSSSEEGVRGRSSAQDGSGTRTHPVGGGLKRKKKKRRRTSRSKVGLCCRFVLGLASFMMGLFFVVGPFVLVAGVKSGQIRRSALENFGVADVFEDLGLIERPRVVRNPTLLSAFEWLRPGGLVSQHALLERNRAALEAAARELSGDGNFEREIGQDVRQVSFLESAQGWLVNTVEKLRSPKLPSSIGRSQSAERERFGSTEQETEELKGKEPVVIPRVDETARDVVGVLQDQLKHFSPSNLLKQTRSKLASQLFTTPKRIPKGPPWRPSQPATGSGIKAEVERRRFAEFLPPTHVEPSGPIDAVQQMVNGRGPAYNLEVPWAVHY